MLIIGLFYIIVPLLLIGVIALTKASNKFFLVLNIFCYGLILSFLWASTRWDVISIYLKPLFIILFLLACFKGFKNLKKSRKMPGRMAYMIGITLNAALIVFFSGLNWFAYKGYISPDDPIDLESPLRNGKYIVLHGGGSPFTNGHYHVRPQNFALDIVALNNLGMRASTIGGGSKLENYVIYDKEIYSPCEGRISVVVDQLVDLNPPEADTKNLAGNHILIECKGVEVLLAHLKNGSIQVKEGDQVSSATILGKAGNTGNTSEPHLHMHVEQGGEPNTILNGKAVPFTINKKYLVRGSVIK